jgi:hypothetical protein
MPAQVRQMARQLASCPGRTPSWPQPGHTPVTCLAFCTQYWHTTPSGHRPYDGQQSPQRAQGL